MELILLLANCISDLIKANQAADAEAERIALLKAQRAISDALADKDLDKK